MRRSMNRMGLMALLIGAAMLQPPFAAHAEEIVVSNYGVSINGAPFAVALAKGYFQEEGADVTGIITSAGGGTSLRNMIAGGVPYAEVNPTVAVAARHEGADIRMIADNVLTVAEFLWVVKPDSEIQSMEDVRGKKLGYTNPRSTSQGLVQELVKRSGLSIEDVELVRTGGFGEGVAALDSGIIDVTPMPEPLWSKFKDKYRPIARATDILPPLANVVAVTTDNMAAERGDFIRGVINARRRAVEFMIENPEEAGDIVAEAYSITPEEGRSAVTALTTSDTEGVPYWGPGYFHMDGLRNMIQLQKDVDALPADLDVDAMLDAIVDTQFLPEDLRDLR